MASPVGSSPTWTIMVEQILMRGPAMPLIVAEGLDVILFSSTEAAESRLESIDVRAGTYKGFDAKGRALRIELREGIPDDTSVMAGQVQVALAEEEPSHAAELRHLLRAFLDEVGQRLGDASVLLGATRDATVEELVQAVARFAPQE